MDINSIVYSHDGKETHLKNITAHIAKGKITTIIGPNGCGKSTLLGVMSNHFHPEKGHVILEQKDIMAYKSKALAKKLAIVHQQNSAPVDMTVEKLVGYGRLPYKSIFQTDFKTDQAVVDWALEKTRLIEKRKNTLDALSGGERQRVWIAMALAQKSEYLFLDEPTTYLDIFYQFDILELVKSLNETEKLTIVMVLHDINQAIRYSDELIVMKRGEIIAQGKPEDVITKEQMKDVYQMDMAVVEDEMTGLYTIPIGF